jgi:hypothetical protein
MQTRTKVIIGVSTLVVGYVAYKLIKAGIDKNKSATVVPDTFQTTKGINFYNLADDLFSAMDGYGTDEQTIYDTFNKLGNQFDFAALVKAYGNRTLSSGFGNVFVPNFTGDLVASLKDELSGSEIATLNQILTSKGIKTI